MDNPDMIQPAETGRKSRRGILAALGLGGAATAVALSSRPAQAQESTDTTVAAAETTAPATETPTTEPMLGATAETTSETVVATEATTPPAAIQPEDRPLIAAAKVLELTVAQAYAEANARIADLGLDAAATALFGALEAHHKAYAEALSGAYGPGSPNAANPALLAKMAGDKIASGAAADVLLAAHEAEHAAADTYLDMLGALRSTDMAALVASIQISEYRHAATIDALMAMSGDADDIAIEDGAGALSVDVITGGK